MKTKSFAFLAGLSASALIPAFGQDASLGAAGAASAGSAGIGVSGAGSASVGGAQPIQPVPPTPAAADTAAALNAGAPIGGVPGGASPSGIASPTTISPAPAQPGLPSTPTIPTPDVTLPTPGDLGRPSTAATAGVTSTTDLSGRIAPNTVTVPTPPPQQSLPDPMTPSRSSSERWVPGHYTYQNNQWTWMNGTWATPPTPGSEWAEARYDAGTRTWTEGYWRNTGNVTPPPSPNRLPPTPSSSAPGSVAPGASINSGASTSSGATVNPNNTVSPGTPLR